MDDIGLAYIEQPLADDDIVDHAVLQKAIKTPICLDESIVSLEATRKAIALGSCRVVNIKSSRCGGILESIKMHMPHAEVPRERGCSRPRRLSSRRDVDLAHLLLARNWKEQQLADRPSSFGGAYY